MDMLLLLKDSIVHFVCIVEIEYGAWEDKGTSVRIVN
jgi:hypothetical protein